MVFFLFISSNLKEVVNSLNEIYDVGTFVHIAEVRQTDSKLTLLLSSIRRVRIKNLAFESVAPPGKSRKFFALNYWFLLKLAHSVFILEPVSNSRRIRGRPHKQREPPVHPTTPSNNNTDAAADTQPSPPPQPQSQIPNNILLVETENLTHDKYKYTDEVKVSVFANYAYFMHYIWIFFLFLQAYNQEILKTIREIITLNPFYRLVNHYKQIFGC